MYEEPEVEPVDGAGRKQTYAAQWSFFTIFMVVIAGGPLVSANADQMIIAASGQGCVLAGTFIAGFCYRERLTQLGRSPRWKAFRRMFD